MSRYGVRAVLPVALAVSLAIAGCGSDKKTPEPGGGKASGGGSPSAADVSGTVSFVGVWTADEQKSFQAVLVGFKAKYPNVTVKYQPAGDQLPTVLATAVQGGKPPDLASIAQPGLVKDFASKGALKPLDFASGDISSNFPESFVKLGTIDGKLYGLFFKAANKSTVWFNTTAYKSAGVSPATSWDDFLKNAKTLKASGVPAYSIGGADGWTLTDLFENIYLRTAGAEMYDKLAAHQIPWTDPSVKTALGEMAKILGDTANLAGGTAGALQTDFPTSVTKVFANPPKAAQVIEGDFVAGTITSMTKAKPGTGFDEFAFPSINGSGPAVMGGGDEVVMFKDTPAAQALVKYLATAEAATLWANRGGFSSPNKNVDASVYPDDITRKTATAIAAAETFRFDMSDLQPASFGGTVGQGEWKLFQDFVRRPTDVNGIAAKLEAAAAKAYASGK
jgi:alpha-glucoside transport system substrate-binding protein